MLVAIQSLYNVADMRMNISGMAGAAGTAKVGVCQGWPHVYTGWGPI